MDFISGLQQTGSNSSLMMAAAVSDVTLSQSIFPEERMENFLMKSLQIEENVSFFASDNGRLVVEMFLCLWFLVVIELYNTKWRTFPFIIKN